MTGFFARTIEFDGRKRDAVVFSDRSSLVQFGFLLIVVSLMAFSPRVALEDGASRVETYRFRSLITWV